MSVARSSSVDARYSLCFSRRQDGVSGLCRLAKQDLFAQTLRIRIIGAAFPLVQSSPSHSAGQNCQNGLMTPAGQPLNVQTCPPATPPRAVPRTQPRVTPEAFSPYPLLFSLPPSGPCPGLTEPGKFLEGTASFMHFYIASNSGHSLNSLPSCQCRMMVRKGSLTAVYRREAEEGEQEWKEHWIGSPGPAFQFSIWHQLVI